MGINHVIIHEVKREKDGEVVVENLRETENNAAGLAGKLTDSLISLFTYSTLNIGEFAVDGDIEQSPAFEQKLAEYYDHLTCSNFVSMTQDMAKRYARIMRRNGLQKVKGGLLIFYEYENKGKAWLALAVLQRSEGYNASQNLELELSQIIDINKLHLGAAINLTDWEEDLSSRYIKFKAGLAADVRDYFEDFVGCKRDKQAANTETKNLKKAIQQFAQETLKYADENVQYKIDEAYSYIKEKLKLGDVITLIGIANKVFAERSEDFLILARDIHEISDELAISDSELKKYLRITGKSKGISISFDRKLLDKSIVFKDDKLTFTEVPESLKVEIKEELANRQADSEDN
jgi:nucleoid-associated protein